MKVSVGSLGGIGEIGMNMYVYETENSAIIVDCGVKFAGPSDLGIDRIIPDFSYLDTIKDKLKCLLISHAHEDHIGAVSYFLERFKIPLVSSKFSMDLMSYKLKELSFSVDKRYICEDDPFEAGDFLVSFIPLSHSIQGTGAFYIQTFQGFSALHISDYKIDFSPVSGSPFQLKPFLDLGDEGLTCLVSDSTNALSKGFTMGEKKVASGLDKVFEESVGRIFFTTFASNSERIGTVINLAEKHRRKVALEGSSLLKNIETARRNGLLTISPETIVPRKQIERLNDNEICVIATGSQGESASVITKISKSDYANLAVRETDTFVFSSRIIPGNEQNIINVMNGIAFRGGKCITVDFNDSIHASGHACEEDIKTLLKLTCPKYLIPVHGEYIHLQKHREIGKSCGLHDDNIILMRSGMQAVFEDGEFIETLTIESGKNFVDSKNGFLLNLYDLRERKRLAYEGGVFVYILPDMGRGLLEKDPVISTMGFPLEDKILGNLVTFLKLASEMSVFERFSRSGWRDFVAATVKKYFKKHMGRRPIISVIIGDLNDLA